MNDCNNRNGKHDSEFTSQEKAANITWRIAKGDAVTITEVAESFGMTWQGAYKMMTTISRVIPIAPNSTGKWQRFDIR